MSIVQSEAKEDSAFHRFNCGSKETLGQEGVREALLNFHKQWYSANIMKLCLVSRYDMPKLEQMARDLFLPVLNKSVTVPDFGQPAPYDHTNLGHLYKIVPVKDKDILSLTWFLPYT